MNFGGVILGELQGWGRARVMQTQCSYMMFSKKNIDFYIILCIYTYMQNVYFKIYIVN